jgi:thiol-disulfide isomerase/thioredoxin
MIVKVLQNNANVNNDELNNIIKHNTLFVGVFSESCHYCVSMKPEWKKFKKMALANYSNLQGAILEIDSSVISQVTNPLLTNNVNGYPSLFIISNNKVLKYNNERTAFEFMKFFKLHIHKSQSRTSQSRTSQSRTSKSRASEMKSLKKKASKSRTQKSKLYYPKSFRRFLGNKS